MFSLFYIYIDKASSNNTSRGTEWYIIVVSLVSGIIIGILLSYIASCCRRKFRSRKPHSNPEPKTTETDTTDYQELDLSQMNTEDNYRSLRNTKPQSTPEPKTTEADTTYQELDLSKVNTEDNYQSLRVNAASNEEESTYTELNKARDVGNNYQSLT